MDEFKAVLASNIIKLRTDAGMTQAELGEKLNYSDKSISKWERAEGVPDALVIKKMGEIFGVSVDYLVNTHDQWTKPKKKLEEKSEYSHTFIILSSIAGIWLICVIEFVVLWIIGYVQWLTFVVAVPVSLVTLLIMNSLWNKGKGNMWIVAALVLCAVAAIYLALLDENLWQLFIILVPAELLVYLAFHIRKGPKTGDSTNSRE